MPTSQVKPLSTLLYDHSKTPHKDVRFLTREHLAWPLCKIKLELFASRLEWQRGLESMRPSSRLAP